MRMALLGGLSLLLAGGSAMALTLAKAGQSDYVIGVPADASAPVRTAAQELQSYLQQVTGATLVIKAESEVPEAAKQIVVGAGARFRAACPEVDLAALKHDGIVLKTKGDTLYLAGGEPRGTLYAVYSFLEEIVGVRWWGERADETFVPQRPTLEIPSLDKVYVPALQYREAFVRCAFGNEWAARNKCNGHFARVRPEYGGHYRILGWCHTFYQLLPPSKYFADHPEWYSEVNGRRTAEHAQLCLSNDEMRAELTRQALVWLRQDPDAGMISISQNDWGGACQCAKCRAVVAEEGAESGSLLRFVNAVAADLEPEFPGVYVETLAYHYTRKPPKLVKPRRNVMVRLCSIEASSAEPLATGEQNASFRSDIEGWSAIAPQLYIWNYVTNFANYITPHPNWRVLGLDIRYFADHRCIGLFEQGDAGSSCSDFPELRAWLMAQMMWDPSRDAEALIAEFLQGYYGAAAKPLREYMTLLENRLTTSGARLPCFLKDTSSWLDLATANRATELFDEAAARVQDNPVLAARVRRARLPLDHNWLQRYKGYRRLAQMSGTPFLGPADPAAAVEEFIRTCQSFQVGQFREGVPFAQLEVTLRGMFPPSGKAARVPPEAAGLPADQWLDIQQGEFDLHGLGRWVTVAPDPEASDEQAARMPANHNQWATQFAVPVDLAGPGKWRCYLVVRCAAKVKTGNAFDLGLYDAGAGRNVAGLRVKLEQAGDNAYHTYDLGAHELKGGMYFWVAPLNNPDQVEAVYTDRIFLVREKAQP